MAEPRAHRVGPLPKGRPCPLPAAPDLLQICLRSDWFAVLLQVRIRPRACRCAQVCVQCTQPFLAWLQKSLPCIGGSPPLGLHKTWSAGRFQWVFGFQISFGCTALPCRHHGHWRASDGARKCVCLAARGGAVANNYHLPAYISIAHPLVSMVSQGDMVIPVCKSESAELLESTTAQRVSFSMQAHCRLGKCM